MSSDKDWYASAEILGSRVLHEQNLLIYSSPCPSKSVHSRDFQRTGLWSNVMHQEGDEGQTEWFWTLKRWKRVAEPRDLLSRCDCWEQFLEKRRRSQSEARSRGKESVGDDQRVVDNEVKESVDSTWSQGHQSKLRWPIVVLFYIARPGRSWQTSN